MSIAHRYAEEIENALERLGDDEWAVVRLRENIVKSSTPQVAFDDIVDVLIQARATNDVYAFSSVCWLAADLAELSNTTQRPVGLEEAIDAASEVAGRLGCESELERLRRWYRYGT